MMNDEIYKDLFSASKNFQNFAKRVRRFPQPLYMISLFEIFFDKVNSYLPKKTKNYKAHYTPILSDQVERNLRDLTSIHIHETSDKKKETYMIFTLQPLITINKNFKTENEINLLKQIKMKNYKEIAKKYYNEFSSIYSNLDNEFSENNYVRFINLKDIFQNEKGNVYTSWAHYNDYGCKLIAQEIYNKLSNEIDLILKRKNNSF